LRVPIAKLLVRSLRSNLQAWFGVVKSALRRGAGVLPGSSSCGAGRKARRLETEGGSGKRCMITWKARWAMLNWTIGMMFAIDVVGGAGSSPKLQIRFSSVSRGRRSIRYHEECLSVPRFAYLRHAHNLVRQHRPALPSLHNDAVCRKTCPNQSINSTFFSLL
jgi:hypothetical protein